MSAQLTSAERHLSEECIRAQGQVLLAHFAEWITEHYGERCDEYQPGCFACMFWRRWDALREAVNDPVAAGEKEQ